MPVGTRRSTRLNPAHPRTEPENQDSAEPRRKSRKKSAKQANIEEGVGAESARVKATPAPILNIEQHDGASVPDVISDTRLGVNTEEEKEQIEKKSIDLSCNVGQVVGESQDKQIEETVIKEKNKAKEIQEDLSGVIRSAMEAYKHESVVRKQIKGKPKSGRVWKTEQTARFSSLRKDKPLKSSWQLKMAQKAEKLSVRKFQQELHDAKRQEIELRKQRRAEHQKRREENQKKSEVVQVIRKTAKLKRMKKKQLRYLEKR